MNLLYYYLSLIFYTKTLYLNTNINILLSTLKVEFRKKNNIIYYILYIHRLQLYKHLFNCLSLIQFTHIYYVHSHSLKQTS
jgi:hypothetical protein